MAFLSVAFYAIAAVLLLSEHTQARPTQIPTRPAEGCFHDGKFYHNEEIFDREDCSEKICMNGQIVIADFECAFRTPSEPTTAEREPSTLPTRPAEGCFHNGKFYRNDEVFDREDCSEKICMNGQIVIADFECAFRTPSEPPTYTAPPTSMPPPPPGI
ncbi:collagen [Desmophyllum pertusum]|uniref:Collagen n=1 Tax=Desmophyllum pertusum TaxID=174260 RepID=A0A9W9ZTN8_9CNID|nr:collagen [Desmophyllum pertusum]